MYNLFRGNTEDKHKHTKKTNNLKTIDPFESYALNKDWVIAIKYKPRLIRIADDLL